MNKIHPVKKEFCTTCGRQLVEQDPITADHFGSVTDTDIFYISSPYDKETGKLRMRRWVACPKRKELKNKGLLQSILSLFDAYRYHDAHPIGKEYLV